MSEDSGVPSGSDSVYESGELQHIEDEMKGCQHIDDEMKGWAVAMDTARESRVTEASHASSVGVAVVQTWQSTSAAMQGCRPYGDTAKNAQPRWMALQTQGPKGAPASKSSKGFFLDRTVSFGCWDQVMSPTKSEASMMQEDTYLPTPSKGGTHTEGDQRFGGLLQDVVSNLQRLSTAVRNMEEWHRGTGGNLERRRWSSVSSDVPREKRAGSAGSGSDNGEIISSALCRSWQTTNSTHSAGQSRPSDVRRTSRTGGTSKRMSNVYESVQLELRPNWQQTEEHSPDFEVVAVELGTRTSGNAYQSALRRARSMKHVDDHWLHRALHALDVLHPYSFSRLMWNIACVAAICYDLFAIPLRAFNLPEEVNSFMRVLDWILAIFWTADVLVSARTGFYVKAVLHMDAFDILKHYSKTWLVPDLILVGLSWFATVTTEMTRTSNVFRARAFGFLRWLRLGRMWKMSNLWRMIEDFINTPLFHLGLGLVKLTVILITMLHITSCAWYAIGESKVNGWTSYYYSLDVNGCFAMEGPRNFYFWYFASSRWTLAQINGRTDIDERRTLEELYYTCAVAILFAVIFMSIFISSITTTMVELSAAAEAETSTQRLMDEYLGYYQVPMVLVGSVKRHLRDMSFQQDQQKENRVLEKLPRQLASDLLYEIHSPVLLNASFFQELDATYPRVMRHLCSGVVTPVSVHKWEMIFDIGDACSRMLFVRRGELNYSNDHNHGDMWTPDYQNPDARPPPGQALHKGSWLCEAALWLEWVNRGRLIAAEQSSLLSLDAKKFADLMRDYKEAHLMASTYAKGFLDTLNREESLSDRIAVQMISYRQSLESLESLEVAQRGSGLQVGKNLSSTSKPWLSTSLGSMALAWMSHKPSSTSHNGRDSR